MTATLTIAIPTFDRREAVRSRLLELRDAVVGTGVTVMVIDNASTDGTFTALSEEFGSEFRILRNDSNLGYAGNFLRVIEAADTDYVVVVSDEDRVEPTGLVALIEFCSTGPLMVCPRADVRSNSLYRGRGDTRPIAPKEFHSASFYVSGLTFDVTGVRGYVARVRELVETNSAAAIYPQVLVAAMCVAGGNSYFLDAVVTTQVATLQTRIAERSGEDYRGVRGRWSQFLGYESFFATDLGLGPVAVQAIAEMRDERRGAIMGLISSAAVSEVPQLAVHFALPTKSLGARVRKWIRSR